jgi:hypothetical protein
VILINFALIIESSRPPWRGRAEAPSKLIQVSVDNFCYAATQSKDGAHIPFIRQAAIHGIEAVFPPPSITQHQGGKEPVSESKLLKGDGNFESKKDMIEFRFDGIKQTVHLLPEKALAYIKEGPNQDPARCGWKAPTRFHYLTRRTRLLYTN